MTDSPILAFDVGGSFVKAGVVVVARGRLAGAVLRRATPADAAPGAVMDLLAGGRAVLNITFAAGCLTLRLTGLPTSTAGGEAVENLFAGAQPAGHAGCLSSAAWTGAMPRASSTASAAPAAPMAISSEAANHTGW